MDTKLKSPEFRRTEDFAEVYANNINFEASLFDLKILFGQLNQAFDPNVIDQHTAVTIAWAEAKLLLHFLTIQLALYEDMNGKILIHPSLLPPPPAEPDEKVAKNEPQSVRAYQIIKAIRDEFIKDSTVPRP